MSSFKFKNKETNTFRFKSFSERVNDIDIRKAALYYIGHENEELPEDDETYFHQTIKKWNVLNLTDEYNQFSKKCSNIVTLPQLIHKKDFIVDFLLEKLSTATTLALQPLLEIIVVLGKDLREEFYPYFQRILDRLICLLNTQDADQLEWTFICLAFLFKTLKPFLKKNIKIVFNSILPLLDETRYSEQVINFAVECFAFIARDIRQNDYLLSIILKSLETECSDGIQGCGRLFFEIIRGVSGNFHSVAKDFLNFLSQSILCKTYNQYLLERIVSGTIQNILAYIHPHNMSIFWIALCDAATDETATEKSTCTLLDFMSQSVAYKNGTYLNELDTVVACILKMIDNCEDELTMLKTSNLICLILLSNNAKVSQLDTCRLCKKILSVPHRAVFEEFVWNISGHPQFDFLVFPEFVKYFEQYFDEDSLQLMAKIVIKKSADSETNEEWKRFPFVLKKKEIQKKFIKILSNTEMEKVEEEFLLAVIILPHLNGIELNAATNQLEKYATKLSQNLNETLGMDLQRNLFILFLVTQSLLHHSKELKNKFYETITMNILEYCSEEKHILGLKTLNLLIKNSGATLTNAEYFDKVHSKLSNNLFSPSYAMRTISIETLNYFGKNTSLGLTNIYNIFHNIEQITPTVHKYRDQVLLMQKFSPDGEFFKNIQNPKIKLDCLKFLIGLLYYNFKLLWDPTLKMIEDLSAAVDVQDFWDIYKFKLEQTANIINREIPDPMIQPTEGNFKNDILARLFDINFQVIHKIDYNNFRNLLWSRLHCFGQISEMKNHDIVTLFLKFVETEYKSSQETKILTWNILQINDTTQLEADILSDNEDDDDEDTETKATPKKRRKIQTKGDASMKSIVSTLGTKLTIFSKQGNPKQMHREPELFQLYLDLLSCKNSYLQKMALDCIKAYKNKSIAPYIDHLYGLIDEKKFKDELINFKIGRENTNLIPEHRKEFMPVCLRILYGKMITKGSAKNMGSQVRKGVILRFLGGCEKDEIAWFLKMAFGLYDNILDGKLEEIPQLVESELNLEKVWSPRKLLSTINLLEIIRKEFGGLMDSDFLIYVLKLITFVGCVCQKVLEKSEQVNKPKVLTVFKNVKTAALVSLVNFFEHFENFEWTDIQIKVLTEIFVWSNIEKLPQDSIHSPTPLLKLLSVWSQDSRHFSNLIQIDDTGKLIPFKFVIDLLLNEKAKPLVRNKIMEMIERLLMGEQDTMDSNAVNLNTIGITVVRPYMPEILKRLKMNFSQKRARTGLDKRDLNILSMLTNLVEEPETCDSLLQLLLPILVTKSQTSKSDEVVGQVITTLSNLIKKLDNPEIYVRKIGPLFEQISEVTARKMLCTLLIDIGKICGRRCPNLIETSKIIKELNAWDARWIEQPNYDKRMDALKVVTKKLEENSVDMDLGLLVIYNCFYFVKYDKDMGMRDNASEHLKKLVPKLVNRYQDCRKDIDYLIGDVLLDLVRRTLRDSNDNVRNEGILLLGEMARECSESHQILQDLSSLTDKEDEEVDFFGNVTHLQSYRHGKALLKFCSVAKLWTETPNYKTLTQFILPLATRYLLSEKYASKHTLVDAAIEAVGIVCQLLPWQHYQAILKFYLQKMRFNNEHQKQSVRIVVVILDAFHFNLSSGGGIDTKKLKSQITANEEIEKPVKQEHEKDDEEEGEENVDVEVKDEDLDNELNEISENDESMKICKVKLEPIVNRTTELGVSSAKKVIHTIATILIPTLNYSITEKSTYDAKHKLNRKRFSMEREEEEILRVPIALALVKLLQKLPKQILDSSLSGVFMKVCTFLKSPLKSVRMLTRDILKKIMLTLGASYLAMLLEQLTTLLTRGFQVHVLSVTVHGVLDVLKEQFQPGDIESCLANILEVTLNDIFGEIGAEKEIDKITAHTPEAKPSAKSYLSLHIAARNISENCLLDILMPFKDYLAKSQSKRTVTKIQDCFQKIVTGLVENQNISRESILIFIYGTMSESIIDLLPGAAKPILSESDKDKMRRARPDCLLIAEAPRSRAGAIRKNVKTNTQANAHVLIEFGLEMLHIVLKRKKLDEIEYQPFVNPLLPLLKDSLKSSHIRVTTFALKCFAAIWNGGYQLEKITEVLAEVVQDIFQILHKYSTYGTTKKDENFHFVRSAFKAVVALLRNCEDYTLNTEHTVELLFYIEQDIEEADKQPMAFSLLKAIVSRKVGVDEIHEIMNKLCQISITSSSDFARDEARSILIFYIMEYPLKKKVDGIMKFFTTQLNFEVVNGRLSAIKFLQLIIRKFPQDVLTNKSEFLFLTLGTRLVNEEVPECRIAVADCLEHLIGRVDKETKQRLFEINLMLLVDGDKPSVREMGAVLCSRFIVQEKNSFWPRVKLVLPILIERLTLSNPTEPGRFVKVQLTRGKNDTDETDWNVNGEIDKDIKKLKEQEKDKAIDHELIQIQNCILKIFEFCPEVLNSNDDLDSLVDELAYESQKLLGYEHEWVRLNATKLLSHIIATLDSALIGNILLKNCKADDSQRKFIYWSPENDLKSIVLDLCAQMIPGETGEEIAEEIIKICLLIANMLKVIPIASSTNTAAVKEESEKTDDQSTVKINLNWLLRRMRYVIHGEISKAPHSCILRTAVLNWLEGLITLLEVEIIENLAETILSPLVREMSEEDHNIDPKLRQQAMRVGSKLRKRIGSDIYDKLRNKIQTKLMMRRAERRKQIAQEKINDPVRAAKRKQGVSNRKKLSKKRKIDVIKGKIEGKRKRKRKIEEDIF